MSNEMYMVLYVGKGHTDLVATTVKKVIRPFVHNNATLSGVYEVDKEVLMEVLSDYLNEGQWDQIEKGVATITATRFEDGIAGPSVRVMTSILDLVHRQKRAEILTEGEHTQWIQ